MVRELEKGGARVTSEDEKLRHYEVIFAGDADGSLAAARDDVYAHPGAKPEYRFSGIMEDLRRRDFSINAIAVSLNAQSRGLLLDPMNGLADLERQEIRALSVHAFTNQPIRLMRILRYCGRMGCKMESRTQEWFDLAMERGLQQNIQGSEAGDEVRSLAREDNPVHALKQWESHELLAAIHPQLQRRKPDYDSLNKLAKVRNNFLSVGIRPRPEVAVTNYILGRLKSSEASAALRRMEFRAAETEAISHLIPEGQKIARILKGHKTDAPRDAYLYLASVPPEMLAFIEIEMPNPRVGSKIRNYLQKWRPMRQALPGAELEALGVPRGPKFDKVLDQLFDLQLRGRARSPEDRTKALRSLAGIKEEPKKKEEKEKKKRKDKDVPAAPPAPVAKNQGKPAPKAAAPPLRAIAKAATAEPKPQQSAAAVAIGARARAKHDEETDPHRLAEKPGRPAPPRSKARAGKKSRGK